MSLCYHLALAAHWPRRLEVHENEGRGRRAQYTYTAKATRQA
jgi:hypothetical protein